MKTININKSENIRTLIFPDNQPHINISNIQEGDEVKVICSITDTDLLFQLLECANAIEHAHAKKKLLMIPYLLTARSDRLMQTGDSVDLEVMANLINNLQFEKVCLYDVHSEVATRLIKNAVNISNKELVLEYKMENAVLICPDAGAVKKVNKYFEWNENLTDIIYCNKTRDLSNGKITLNVPEPEKCRNRNCVIIDDICDGGGTFLAIAEQIQPGHLTLVVTHGIFSKGFENLEKYFDKIIVSDSYKGGYDSAILKLIKKDYEKMNELLTTENI